MECSCVPKPKEAVMHLTETMCVSDKLHSGNSYSAVGGVFGVNASKNIY